MQSAATTPTTQASTPALTPVSTPATPDQLHGQNNAPQPLKRPAVTKDFYLDTFFSPVWTSGPHVFSFAENGTIVRPETYTDEPYPGYNADRERFLHPETAHETAHSQGSRPRRDPKPWKDVAITEQDDEELEETQARAFERAHAVGEWEHQMQMQRQMRMYYNQHPHPLCGVPGREEGYMHAHPPPQWWW